MTDKLQFDPNQYETKTMELDGRTIRYREYSNISYCENPVSDIQKMNIYVPEVFYETEEYKGYTLKTVPIFMPNNVGGYREGSVGEPGVERYLAGNPNSVFEALDHGYVVACAGIRGRNTGVVSSEFFVGESVGKKNAAEGKKVGRAPALAVDMKAAVRYLRHNSNVIPGDPEKIITNGTSAGGALSAITGASGNSKDYEPYLKAIGAADERDDIFAASCYCPIHNLEHADSAYEWLFNKEHKSHMIRFEEHDGVVSATVQETALTEEQIACSAELKREFTDYVNSLRLTDQNGNELSLDENGEGRFKDYVFSFVKASAEEEMRTQAAKKERAYLTVKGSDVENMECLSVQDGKVTSIDTDGYVAKITRMKPVPSFDAFDLKSPENEEFGDEISDGRHFTEYSLAHSKVNREMADPAVIKMLNPTKYLGEADTAKHWRIRHGSFDRDTSLAIPVILATLLENKGYDVDFALPWGVPHSGDYDLPELFAWIDEICK